jgi:RNA polymerase sigma-70 factor (ECF subfamily)
MVHEMDEATVTATVKRAQLGDPVAFERLYAAFEHRVRALCRQMLGSSDAAHDATSEVFLRAQAALQSYDPTRPFEPWLFRIASNHCRDQLRRRGVEHRIFSPKPVEEPLHAGVDASPLREAIAAERRTALHQAIAALPEHYRIVVMLRFYADQTYEEIADTLGLERANVATLLFRARQRLRREMEKP